MKVKEVEKHNSEEKIFQKYFLLQEFRDVFTNEFLGLPLKKEFDFSIDFILGAQPISKTPYRMTIIELQELKIQLQDLLEKGLIKLSVLM